MPEKAAQKEGKSDGGACMVSLAHVLNCHMVCPTIITAEIEARENWGDTVPNSR